jgi:DNA/RNA endonuclease YhcR with UshA esterase domain
VKCKNLWVGDYEGLIQMGAFLDSITDPQTPSIESIPTAVVGNYILKGKYNIPVQPVVVTINQLDFSTYQNMFIQLQDVEFDAEAINTTYADAENKFSQNKKLVDCSNNEILVRTSGYAKFADAVVPSYQGTLNAVYSVFRTDRQLYMNTAANFQANGNNRCTGPGSTPISSIASIRSLFSGASTTIGSSKAIKGIVISDRTAANIDGRNLVIQDSTAGIVIRFSSTHAYSLGDAVEINISGQKLSEFNGLLQAEVPNANAAKIGIGTITPRTLTVAQAVSGLETYESQLINIQNVTLSGGGGKYSGNVSMNDGTGTMNMFTRNAASFASSNYPGGVVSVTGILSQFNSVQLNIRNINDVQQ